MIAFGIKAVGVAGRNLCKVAFQFKCTCGQIILIRTIAVDTLHIEVSVNDKKVVFIIHLNDTGRTFVGNTAVFIVRRCLIAVVAVDL